VVIKMKARTQQLEVSMVTKPEIKVAEKTKKVEW